jgi:hypothetical protein
MHKIPNQIDTPRPLEAPEIQDFPHGADFLNQAISYLEKNGINPDWGKVYHLEPGSTAYNSFFAFLISELENLPFNNEMGDTMLQRIDAKQCVAQLITYLKEQLVTITQTKKWALGKQDQILPMFQDDLLEVFKNEIYPKHKKEGIGYNLDLSARNLSGTNEPSGIVLERRLITNSGQFRVMDHGFFNLNLISGTLKMDLEEFPTTHVHTRD